MERGEGAVGGGREERTGGLRERGWGARRKESERRR